VADLGGHSVTESDWEAAWAPYDEATYAAALAAVGPDDVIIDIGAGDLRLARRLAAVVRHVYAVERRADILKLASSGPGSDRRQGLPLPHNLSVICADARVWPFPTDVTAGVLLMRHCRHFGLYVAKLRAAGARKLITNARWGMGVEVMDLRPGLAWEVARRTPGWYACVCGAVGFIEGPADQVPDWDEVRQVEECERCRPAADLGLSDILRYSTDYL
jgi:hypothetical protein